MEGGSDELLAAAGLALDEHGDVGVGDLVELCLQRAHRFALADDVDAACRAVAQEGVLFPQSLFGHLEMLDEATVGDRERRLLGDAQHHVEVGALEHAWRVAVVDLKPRR